MWRINREALLLGAGPAALLLQIAHPHVAEGVAHHSDFRADPFRRLSNTIHTTMALVFGDGPTAERAVHELNGVHAGVRGDALDPVAREIAGSSYRALDPELLLWVQATLIVTSVRAYERWIGPLSLADRERFWAEARAVGPRLGIPLDRSPQDWSALEAYWARMLAPEGLIRVTPTARELAPHILRPPIRFVPGPLVALIALPGLALLPPRLRDAFGIRWSSAHEAAAAGIARALRGWVRITPSSWRTMPQARAAERQVRKRLTSDAPSLSMTHHDEDNTRLGSRRAPRPQAARSKGRQEHGPGRVRSAGERSGHGAGRA